MFYLYFVPCGIVSYNFFCMQLLFDMFSTLMSIELKLKVKTVNILMYGYNAGPPMAIPIYTVLLYCVIYTHTLVGKTRDCLCYMYMYIVVVVAHEACKCECCPGAL